MLCNGQFYFPLATSLSVSAMQISESTRNRFDQLSRRLFSTCILQECLNTWCLSYILSFYAMTNLLHDELILPYVDAFCAHKSRLDERDVLASRQQSYLQPARDWMKNTHHYWLHRQHLPLHVNSQFVNDTLKGIHMQIAYILIQKWVLHCCSNRRFAQALV